MVFATDNFHSLVTNINNLTMVSDVAIVDVVKVIIIVIMVGNRREGLRFLLYMPSNYIEISCQGSLRLRRFKQHVLLSLIFHVMIELIVTVDIWVAWIEHSRCM